MEPKKLEPSVWAIVTITVAIIGCLGLIGQSFITILPDLLNKSESTSTVQVSTDIPIQNTPATQPVELTVESLTAAFRGQDGADYAVSGCHDGSGSIGIVDNHIILSGVENAQEIERIDIQYGSLNRWQYPCQYPIWELVVRESAEGILDLYFEPEGSNSREVTFLINLTYQDSHVIQTTVVGTSGSGR